MKNIVLALLVVCSSLFLHGCSSGIESDARKAAELNKRSMEYTEEYDIERAEEAYKEAIAVFEKYRNTEDFKEFQELYTRYLNEMQKAR